ncbi:MAG: asparagine synthase (glutamine-hydrolyzing) [Clostridiales bacterium]|nr:asparagine synthase (glutamine-hydrolyzing) [Clostridiales bacterium]
MCGFCGFTGGTADAEKTVRGMMERIAHRGPDSEGTYCDGYVALGFRRLSFLDLEDGTQPMFNEDGSVVIVFNGEIYNYQALRAELLAAGHVFSNRSDTEVLIHLYEEYGEKMLDRLRGMFAFVIYDKRSRRLFGARDFFGIKPFYYSRVGDRLLFASEIKSFLECPFFEKEVNELALENYLTFQYSVLDETFFKGVYKLPPAHYMVFSEGRLRVERYWQPLFAPEERGLVDTTDAIDAAVLDSIEMHKISDVEVGSFLSSGVDSSYVAACFNGGKTFTVGFDYENYNEIEYARNLSATVGIENYNKMITTDEYWESLPKIQYHMDEPLADPSAVALYFVSQVASEHVKAAMSGEGADEFFGGYNIYREPLDLALVCLLPMGARKFLARLANAVPFNFRGKNFLNRAAQTVEERFIGNAKIFSKAEREAILKRPTGKYGPSDLTEPYYQQMRDWDDITKMQGIDLNFWLVGDILQKADKMSMANSLEVRVPFLDMEVFKTASKIQTDFRVNRSATKYAFRLAAGRHMPAEVAAKKKLGFPVPIRIWLREEKYYARVKEAFMSPAAREYFHTEVLIGLLDAHKAGKLDYSRKIWTVYMFLVWYGEFFKA